VQGLCLVIQSDTFSCCSSPGALVEAAGTLLQRMNAA
jgi:hypothetical protein